MTQKTAITPSMFNEHLFRDHVQYYQIQKFVKLSLKWCELYITYDTYRKIDIARARDIFVSQESAFDTLVPQKMRTQIKIDKWVGRELCTYIKGILSKLWQKDRAVWKRNGEDGPPFCGSFPFMLHLPCLFPMVCHTLISPSPHFF